MLRCLLYKDLHYIKSAVGWDILKAILQEKYMLTSQKLEDQDDARLDQAYILYFMGQKKGKRSKIPRVSLKRKKPQSPHKYRTFETSRIPYYHFVLRKMGLEPTRHECHKILSLARLPVPTLPHFQPSGFNSGRQCIL